MKKTEPHLYSTTQQLSGLGVTIGLVCCGLCLLAFPHIVGEMPAWLTWRFSGLGLLVLLCGIFGTCSILFE